MNLIEQLGGYDAAKSIRDINVREFDGDASGVTIYYMGNSFIQEDLVLALLEHRRENNIFEVGDKVVCESFKGLIKVIDILEDRLVVDTGLKTAPNSKSTMAMALPSSMFRHATDKEIAQGFRDE